MTEPTPPTPQTGAPSALVIDDHPLFCDALTLTLTSIADFARIDSAGTLGAGLDRLAKSAVDLIVLDLHLPDVDGLDGLVRLRNAAPKAHILVVSSMAENRMICRALKAGADGFVPKHSQSAVFRRAYAALVAGERFVPESYIDPEGDAGTDAIDRLATLTNQQARILSLICAGRLNKQIAFELAIAETTVKAHVTAIMRKLGVQSRTQAVLLAKEASFARVLP
ncbi:response regulator transcription factor [Roseivivax marinus]|uniref:response regulator n=1 Tax=Roseivivax marinus TaxID=1379903 RepID=UPI001F039068|nr:response regulator transcription factor [Roseivivax marinus]UMA66251.1 response regulator transcription factor [Roseivivax marinus]